MNGKEIRMRCIEALSSMGVREAGRIIADAQKLEEWVNAAPPDKGQPPVKQAEPKADKALSPA